MRYLLGGAVVATLLAAGLPAAAQTGSNGQPPAPSSAEPGARSGATTAPENAQPGAARHAAQHHAHKTTQALAHKRAPGSAQDNMAEALNRQELQRVQQAAGQSPESGTSMPGGATPNQAAPKQ